MTLYELWSGVVPWRDPGNPTQISVTNIMNALMEKKRPFLEINAIPSELKKMIAGCWNEDAKDRPEFVSLYRELCVSEFEEMSSHLKQLSLGGSPSNSSSSALQSLFFFLCFDFEFVELIVFAGVEIVETLKQHLAAAQQQNVTQSTQLSLYCTATTCDQGC